MSTFIQKILPKHGKNKVFWEWSPPHPPWKPKNNNTGTRALPLQKKKKKTLIHRCIIITKLSPQHRDDKTVIFIGQTSRHKLGDCEPQMRKSAQSYGKGVIKPWFLLVNPHDFNLEIVNPSWWSQTWRKLS